MPALPRANDATRPVSATAVMVYGPVEAMTYKLRKGEPVDADTVAVIEGFLRRADALRAAFNDRCSLIDEGTDNE